MREAEYHKDGENPFKHGFVNRIKRIINLLQSVDKFNDFDYLCRLGHLYSVKVMTIHILFPMLAFTTALENGHVRIYPHLTTMMYKVLLCLIVLIVSYLYLHL
jgi:hypothetical protein